MKDKILLLILITLLAINVVGCNQNNKVIIPQKINTVTKSYSIPENEYLQYLNNNAMTIDINDNNYFSSFNYLDRDVIDNEILLIGEIHNIKDNYKIRLKFLKYFKEKTNFKYLLVEDTYMNASFLNKYLESGNKEYLNELFISNKEEFEFWSKVYDYNKKLSDANKLKVVGIDIAGSVSTVQYSIQMLQNKKLTPEIEKDLTLLKEYLNTITKLSTSINDIDDKNLKNQVKEAQEKCNYIYTTIYKNKENYKKILSTKNFDFFIALDNIKALSELSEFTIGSDDRGNYNKIRDLKMHENFTKIYNHLPKGKYFGQFGLSHILQKKDTTLRFGSYLNSDKSSLKGKVLSIPILYSDCTQINYNQEVQQYVKSPISTYKSDLTIDRYLKDNCTLIKLNGSNSPFSKERKMYFYPNLIEIPKDGVTTDYFQYMIIVKKSDSVTPLEN